MFEFLANKATIEKGFVVETIKENLHESQLTWWFQNVGQHQHLTIIQKSYKEDICGVLWYGKCLSNLPEAISLRNRQEYVFNGLQLYFHL